MSLLDAMTGGKSSESSGDIEKALLDIQGVGVPTVQSMQYQLQKLVQAGVLTPEMAQTYLQSPNALASENVDQTGTKAQEEEISQLLGAADQGGLNPNEQAQMQSIIQGLNTQEKGANDAVVQNQAARGALTGGETMAAQLQNNQAADVNANQLGLGTASNAYTQMLNELTSAGAAGSALQGQENTQANTVASATNAINQFNAAQQQATENENVGAKNTAQQFNLENEQGISNQNTENANAYSAYQAQLPQEVEQDQMQKAAAEAGVSENAATNATTQGGQEAGLIGGLVGAAGDVGAAYATPVKAAYGGEIESFLNGGIVDGKAKVHGNSPKNDTVPAVLSPGEVVLPRTISQNPQPDKVMSFLNRIRGSKMPHPDDTAHVLKALGRLRGEQ